MTQTQALDILKAGYNVLLTGSAGSGKTYILNRFIDYLKLHHKNVGITASTGVAATHINGMTVHTWIGLGTKAFLSDSDLKELTKRTYLRRRLQHTDVLIIDEISMLSAETFTAINQILQVFKESDEPFGGIQLVLCGDFFQLPPVSKENEQNYVYKSPLWDELDMKVCYLEKPFRQKDEQFLSILNQIRNNSITRDTWEILKYRFFNTFPSGVTPTRLYTHNKRADYVNNSMLAKLSGDIQTYTMKIEGNETLADKIKKQSLAPEILQLKKRALVMFVKNNFDQGYVNGTMGRIIDFTEREGYPVVETFAKKEIIVKPVEWIIEEDGEMIAKLTQIPLRLAWAITIHKSQGMSLDAAEIDLGQSFVTGMGYVALSRVRELHNIRLKSLNNTALRVSDEVIRIDKFLKSSSDKLALQLAH